MHKIILSFILMFLSSVVALGQYANIQDIDITTTKEYKTARTTSFCGLIAAGVGATVYTCGNIVCMIELNKYTNSHTTTGTVEEIYNLNQEAKQQPAYKRGVALEIGGFVGMLSGASVALLSRNKMNKLKNASGQTIAIFEYAPTWNGMALALRF